MNGRKRFLSLLLLAAAVRAEAAPVTFNTALPISEGVFLYRQQLRWLRANDDPSGMDRELNAQAAVSVLGYGVSPDLAVFGMVPWTRKSLELTAAGNRIERDNRGLGDVKAFARYTFWNNDTQGVLFRMAAFGGLTAPTGKDDESDRFGRLPAPLQDGSGAWNGFGGAVITWQSQEFEVDASLSYQENREANGFEAGDETHLDLSVQRWYWPGGSFDAGILYGLELNGLHQGKNKLNGLNDTNSGGDTLWLAPTLQYVTRRYILEMAVQKPIVQDLNGSALEKDWNIITSVRFIF